MASVEESRSAWSSRTAFLLAAIGGAVGLGNLWRFPYMAGEYGGSGFVIIYLAFVFLLGVPLMAAEMLLGRRGHRSPINAIGALVRDENASGIWKLIGWISVLVPFAGLTYYAVIGAWSIDYFFVAGGNGFEGFDGSTSDNTFNLRIDRPVYQAALHGVFVALTGVVVANGVNKGIERATKVLMPLLMVVIVILVIYGMVAGDFMGAVRFLFNPDFSNLTRESFLVALGQALFSLGIGVGLMITYSSYMPSNFSLRSCSVIICVGDTIAALLAGFAIFPIVFASGLDPAGGPGLIFVTLPIAFGSMPGGHLMGTLFFALLFFAAFTSAIGMLEPVVASLEERYPGMRRKMTVLAGAGIWIIGLGSVWSFSFMADFKPLGFLGIDRNYFGITDFMVANVLPPINAFLIAAFVGWGMKSSSVDEEFSGDSDGWKRYLRFASRYLAPIALLIVFVDFVTS
jgi:NSS family neurotransmitter:Na+ symporter